MQLGNVRLDDDTAKMVEQLTAEFDNNRSEMVREAIRQLFYQRHPTAQLILGYIRLDRPGDWVPGEECPECGQDITAPWIRIWEDGNVDLICEICAE